MSILSIFKKPATVAASKPALMIASASKDTNTLTFKFTSLPHYIAVGLSDLKKDAVRAAAFLDAHKAAINATAETAAALVGVADPALAGVAVVAERASEAAFAAVVAAIDKAGAAASANGVNVALDSDTVAAFKEAVSQIETVVPAFKTPPAGSIAVQK